MAPRVATTWFITLVFLVPAYIPSADKILHTLTPDSRLSTTDLTEDKPAMNISHHMEPFIKGKVCKLDIYGQKNLYLTALVSDRDSAGI